MLDLEIDRLYDLGKEDEGKTFHVLQVALISNPMKTLL